MDFMAYFVKGGLDSLDRLGAHCYSPSQLGACGVGGVVLVVAVAVVMVVAAIGGVVAAAAVAAAVVAVAGVIRAPTSWWRR